MGVEGDIQSCVQWDLMGGGGLCVRSVVVGWRQERV